MKLHPSVLTLVCGFFKGNPSIPSEIPSNVDQRKFNELTQFPARIADTEPPQALIDALDPAILQHLVQAALITGARIAAAELLRIPGNKLPNDWVPTLNSDDKEYSFTLLPDAAGVRVTHIQSGLSMTSTSEDTLDKDRLKALDILKGLVAALPKAPTDEPKRARVMDENDPRAAHIGKIIDEVFKKQGGPENPEQMLAIQKRITALFDKLNLKAEIGCILMPDGKDPEEWASLIKTLSPTQVAALKRLTDAGDQAAIEKFFDAALAAKKAG